MHFRAALVATLLICLATISQAQTAPEASGHWEGNLHSPIGEVGIEIDLKKAADGIWVGTFSRPAQNLRGMPLSNITVKGNSVAFELKATQGGGPFDGILSADGSTMTGQFATFGTAITFDLKKMGEARIEPPAKSAKVAKEFEGIWKASMNAGPTPINLTLTMTNNPDGTASGTIATGEGIAFPVKFTQNGSTVTVEVPAAAATYSGTVNKDGTELTGAWSQQGQQLPLTFRK